MRTMRLSTSSSELSGSLDFCRWLWARPSWGREEPGPPQEAAEPLRGEARGRRWLVPLSWEGLPGGPPTKTESSSVSGSLHKSGENTEPAAALPATPEAFAAWRTCESAMQLNVLTSRPPTSPKFFILSQTGHIHQVSRAELPSLEFCLAAVRTWLAPPFSSGLCSAAQTTLQCCISWWCLIRT